MKIKFTKMQAYGNDYVYIDAINQDILSMDVNELARKVSDRHFYIGSDGMVLICASEVADFRMRMFNPDGSEGEMCGNAIRSLGKFVYDHKLTDKTVLEIETLAGIKILTLTAKEGVVTNIVANIGEPILEAELIPAVTDQERFMEEKVQILDKEFIISSMSWGNPHSIIFVDDIWGLDVHKYGKAIEHATDVFPVKTNVTFAQIIDENYIKIREWERGTGETLGCGTGCCATVVIGHLLGKCKREVSVEQIGGNLGVNWDKDTNTVFMDGPSHTVFEAEIEVAL